MDLFAVPPVAPKGVNHPPLEAVSSPAASYLSSEPFKVTGRVFPPLETVTSPTLNTAAAAYYLNRQPQTLRWWSSLENGPLRPIRVQGRLAWSTSAIKKLMGVA